MRIAIANKYHYIDGGPERYMFGLIKLLQEMGHEAIPFAMAYARNLPSEYSDYFIPPAGGEQGAKLSELQVGVLSRLRIALHSVYSLEARRSLQKLIREQHPQILYCLNIVNHMSPSIIDAAHSLGVPSVLRLSDYNLVCPSYLFLRSGRICTECHTGSPRRALRHRCVHDSLASSACRVLGMYIHRWMRIYGRVSAFITPTAFMRSILTEAGFPAGKIHHIPTFVDADQWKPRYDNDGYVLYFGRLSPEKGVDVLIGAYALSGISDPLLIVGSGADSYVEEVEALSSRLGDGSIRILPQKSLGELQSIVRGTKYVVVPSVWYDNAPNVVLEALASGKPVIASDLGGIPEQVTRDAGILVPPRDTEALAAAMRLLSMNSSMVNDMGHSARRLVEGMFTADLHMQRLLNVMQAICA